MYKYLNTTINLQRQKKDIYGKKMLPKEKHTKRNLCHFVQFKDFNVSFLKKKKKLTIKKFPANTQSFGHNLQPIEVFERFPFGGRRRSMEK